MIRKRAKSFTDWFSSTKRLFVLLVFSSMLLTYVVYHSNSRNSRLTKLVHLNIFKNSDAKTRGQDAAKTSGRNGQPAGPVKEHVRNGKSNPVMLSSYYKTTKTPKLHFDGESKLFMKEYTGEIRHGIQETHGDQVIDIEGDSDLSVDREMNISLPTTREGMKRLLNSGSQIQDVGDNVFSDILEDGRYRRRLPNAIIIGVKKGGTRALLEILKIHPSIRACGNEVHFFDRDENYKKGLEWYRQQMPSSLPGQITIEKSPSYFVVPEVPERVYRMSKTVKLIVIVREPTRRAISDYAQSLQRKPDNPPFEETAIKDPATGEINVEWSKIVIGQYAKHLKRWLKYFPLEQFLFVSGEELIDRPAPEVHLVEKFLNLKSFISESNFYFNETKGFPCFIGKIGNSGNVGKTHCMGDTKGRKHPPVSKFVLQRLRDYFRPQNEEFYSLANRSFHWP